MSWAVEPRGVVNLLSKRIFEFQKEHALCDVMLNADDGVVEAHSLVLAAASPFLCGLFVRLMQDTRSQYSVDLPGFSSLQVRMALCFLYTGQVSETGIATNEVVECQQKVWEICKILGVDLSVFGISDHKDEKILAEQTTVNETFVVIESHDPFRSSKAVLDAQLRVYNNHDHSTELESEPHLDCASFCHDKIDETSQLIDHRSTKSRGEALDKRRVQPASVRRVRIGKVSSSRRDGGNKPRRSRNLACSFCSKVFRSSARFGRHFVVDHRNLDGHSSQERVSRKKLRKADDLSPTGNQSGEQHRFVLACDTCGKNYRTLRCLAMHRLAHDGIKPFLCDTCGQGFQAQSTLDRHVMLRHSDRRPFVCDRCGKGFVARSRLTRHEETHDPATRVRYSCETCGSRFANPGNLMRHRQLHSLAPQPYSCDTCGKTFTQKTSLMAHAALHDPEARRLTARECPICGKTLSKGSNLGRHLQQHHRRKTDGSSAFHSAAP